VFVAAVQGNRARWLGRLDQPHTVHYLEDVARGLAVLGERDEALGEVWHLPAAEPVTGREFLELVFQEAGNPPQIGRVAPWMIRLAGVWSPMVRALGSTLYQWTEAFVSDASKFERAFGPSRVTPHPEAIARTVVWYRYR
jgi:nucleoside-diphosphate-sugar epimerase